MSKVIKIYACNDNMKKKNEMRLQWRVSRVRIVRCRCIKEKKPGKYSKTCCILYKPFLHCCYKYQNIGYIIYHSKSKVLPYFRSLSAWPSLLTAAPRTFSLLENQYDSTVFRLRFVLINPCLAYLLTPFPRSTVIFTGLGKTFLSPNSGEPGNENWV